MKQNERIAKTFFLMLICIILLLFCLYCNNKSTIVALFNIDNYIESNGIITEQSIYKRIGAEITIQYHYKEKIFSFTDWQVATEKVGDSGNATRRNVEFKTAYEYAFLLVSVIFSMILAHDLILFYEAKQISPELRTQEIDACVIKIKKYVELNSGKYKYQYLAEMRDERGKKHKFWSPVVLMPDNIQAGDNVKVVMEPDNYKNYYVKLEE